MTAQVAEVTRRTRDGVRLAGDLYRPAGPPRGAVVLVHGFAGSGRLPGVVAQADALAERGLLVLAYDARGHGRSDGECTLGRLEVADVAAAVEHLRRQHALPVVAVGSSMGAATVLRYAAADPDLAGVVLVSLATRWGTVFTARGLYAAALGRTGLGRSVARRRIGVRIAPSPPPVEPPTESVRRLRVPVAVVHGREDRMVRSRAAVELFEAAPEPRRLEFVARMSHSFQAAAVPAVVRAVEWALERDPTPAS